MAGLSRAKVLEAAKGFRGRANRCLKIARPKVERAMMYEYKARRLKHREMHSSNIIRINAAVRELGTNYSRFMSQLPKAGIELNRKILSQLAETEPITFRSIVDHVTANVVTALPPVPNYRDFGHVCSNVTVMKVPVGKIAYKPKNRRNLVNYY